MNYSIQELTSIIPHQEVIGNLEYSIKTLFFDSRNISHSRNALFIAINSTQNGNAFLEDAYSKKIRAFICDEKPAQIHADATYIIVEDSIKALQAWAKHHFESNQPKQTISITGSNGKTILKEWLNQSLWEDRKIVRSPKSYNSQIGLALSLLLSDKTYDLGIFEVGISKPQEMAIQKSLFSSDIGVLTNISYAHESNFASKQEHITEKITLFENAKTIVYNSENEEVNTLINNRYSDKELLSFGTRDSDTIQLISKKENKGTTTLEVAIAGETHEFIIPFSDEASIENSLCLITCLHKLGLIPTQIAKKLKTLSSVSMRLEIREGKENSLIINDSFSYDYDSFSVALNLLNKQEKERKVLIISSVTDASVKNYEAISKLTNTFGIDLLILVGKEITANKQLFSNANIKTFDTTEALLSNLNKINIANSAILVKGARSFQLEKIAKELEGKSHDTILEVNIQAMTNNYNYFKSLLKTETKIIAMVKADAYGIGSLGVSQALQNQNIDYLAVAYADEGVHLQSNGIHTPIIVMNPERNSHGSVIDHHLEPEVYNFRILEQFIEKLKERSIAEPYPIHIKIDTGMHRLGFLPDEVQELAQKLKQYAPFVEVKSVFSHFSSADMQTETDFTHRQAHALQEAYAQIVATIGYKPMLHICNSAGTINYPEHHFDAIRLGIGLYGYIDVPSALDKIEVVATLKTIISNLIPIKTGESVGYSRRFKAQRDSTIATIPIGYADGIHRLSGNGVGYVAINGQKAPIVGNICMDMLMVDVTDIPCQEDDAVILFGKEPSIVELADWDKTIPYEILTSISPRVKRVFYKD